MGVLDSSENIGLTLAEECLFVADFFGLIFCQSKLFRTKL